IRASAGPAPEASRDSEECPRPWSRVIPQKRSNATSPTPDLLKSPHADRLQALTTHWTAFRGRRTCDLNWARTGLTPRRSMPVTPSDSTPAELLALQALLDRSTRTATPAVADSVAYPARQMCAAEFVEFWRSVRLVAMATVGPAGQPHIAPVHAELAGTTLRLRIYEDTVRRQDLAANPHVAFTTWRADGAVAILYGRAREDPGGLRPAR